MKQIIALPYILVLMLSCYSHFFLAQSVTYVPDEYDRLSKGDHHGPTRAAEDAVIIPLMKEICNSRSHSVRSQCVDCP